MIATLRRHPLFTLLFLALIARTVTALANVGFVAIDDYVYMLKFAFPAQSAPSFAKVLESSWVHPTLPMLILVALGQIPFFFGFDDPLHQMQFVFCLMGAFSLLSVWATYRFFSDIGRTQEAIIAAFLVGFHGVMPFFSTRVLFETFSMPLLTMSLYFCSRYLRSLERKSLLLAIVFLSLASVVRFQTGICFLVIAYFLLLKKQYKNDRLFFISISLLCFALTGAFDLLIGRGFHQSVLDYLQYNILHSSDYGRSKPWNFVLFFIALSFPPFLIRRWKDFRWQKEFSELEAPILYFLIFLISHSLISHKEDRFMIPIIPVFFILLTPLIKQLFTDHCKKRLLIFATLNFVILFLASGFTAQWNTIGTARFLHFNPQIKKMVNFEESLVFMPTAYMNRPELEITNTTPSIKSASTCTVFAVREDRIDSFFSKHSNFQKIHTSQPGPLEWLIVKMNPKRNGRRAAIHLFTPDVTGCNKY